MNSSSIISGVDWVTGNHAPVSVANVSLGGPASDAYDLAVTNSINLGLDRLGMAPAEAQGELLTPLPGLGLRRGVRDLGEQLARLALELLRELVDHIHDLVALMPTSA